MTNQGFMETFTVKAYNTMWQSLYQSQDPASVYGKPDELIEIDEEIIDALKALIAAEGLHDNPGRLEAIIRLEKAQIKAVEQGFLDEWYGSQARVAFVEELSKRGIYEIHEKPELMPGSIYVPWSLSWTPYFLWLIPSLFVYLTLFMSGSDSRSRQTDNLLPINLVGMLCQRLLIGMVFVFAMVAASLLPAFVWATARNGPGVLNYPIVKAIGEGSGQVVGVGRPGDEVGSQAISGQTEFMSAGQYIIQFLVLITFASLFVGVIVMLVSRFTDNPLVPAGISVAIVLIPSFSGYSSLRLLWLLPLDLAPISYLDYQNVIGRFFIPGSPPTAFVFEQGLLIMIVSALVLVMIACIIAVVMRRA
ncbi:MAG: hypothetical protein LBU61_02540 [Coriobacteriales bacterium]|nr:hypothetical protein [Coriobacteriales bacterium]